MSDLQALTLVLGVVYRTISRHLLHKAGLTRASGDTGAVTLVQRFGSALNLNVHFRMLFLDGVYVADGSGHPIGRVGIQGARRPCGSLADGFRAGGRCGLAL